METRSNFGSQKFGTTKIRNDNEDSYASINLPLTLSPPSARADTLEASSSALSKGEPDVLGRSEPLGEQAYEQGGSGQHHPRRRRAGLG
jgi:hypothetical protein